MPQTSPETSSPKSNNARKGSKESASAAAASAFSASSDLSLTPETIKVPPEQRGRRRLTDSYFIPRSAIIPDPDQPRQEFNELEMLELVASIKERGIKQPLTVRWNPTAEKYMVIDGGRRFEASCRLKLQELPCWVQRGEQKEILIDQIVHNWQRANLRPFETADALARLRDEFCLTQKDLCRVTGKPKSEISKLLALHDKVEPAVQKMARSDKGTVLTKRHLYNISKLKPEEQVGVAERVRGGRLNALDTESLIKSQSSKAKPQVLENSGLPSRQKSYHTTLADVLFTFRKREISEEDVCCVLDDIRSQIIG